MDLFELKEHENRHAHEEQADEIAQYCHGQLLHVFFTVETKTKLSHGKTVPEMIVHSTPAPSGVLAFAFLLWRQCNKHTYRN
jgi:hypothetical protein